LEVIRGLFMNSSWLRLHSGAVAFSARALRTKGAPSIRSVGGQPSAFSRWRSIFLVVIVMRLGCGLALADHPGAVDSEFVIGGGLEGTVNCSISLPGGRVLVGGEFRGALGSTSASIVCLLPSGQLDTSLATGTGFRKNGQPGKVNALLLLPDGRVVVGGEFDQYNGAVVHNICILERDGRIINNNLSFYGVKPERVGGVARVNALALMERGNLVIAGLFFTALGDRAHNIAGYNIPTDRRDYRSELDGEGEGLGVANGMNGEVFCLQRLRGSQLCAGGSFSAYSDVRNRVVPNHGFVRLLSFGPEVPPPDGQPRPFAAGTQIRSLALDDKERLYAGGNFINVDGVNRPYVARFLPLPNREVDAGFRLSNHNVTAIKALLPTRGGLLVGGEFTRLSGSQVKGIARLTEQGELDRAFGTGVGITSGRDVRTLLELPKGRVLMGGEFTEINGNPCSPLARLLPDGGLDGRFLENQELDGPILCAAEQRDGRIVLGGEFTRLGPHQRVGIMRVDQRGGIDPSFQSGGGFTGGHPQCIGYQSDGKIVVGGNFTHYRGQPVPRLIRLLPDGDLDGSFNIGQAGPAGGFPVRLKIRDNGELWLAGNFTSYNGVPRLGMALLSANGGLIQAFAPEGTGFNGTVLDFVELPDGRVVAVGLFTQFNRADVPYVVKMTSFGDKDPVFNPGPGPNLPVRTVAYSRKWNRLMLGGSFTSNGLHPDRFATRMNAETGARIPLNADNFDNGPLKGIYAMVATPSGGIVAGGAFNYDAGGRDRRHLLQWTNSGLPDMNFWMTGEPDGVITGMTALAEGGVLVWGSFRQIGQRQRLGVAKILTERKFRKQVYAGLSFGSLPHRDGQFGPESFRMTTTERGAFTLVLRGFAGRTTVKGQFDGEGSWQGSVRRPDGLDYNLKINHELPTSAEPGLPRVFVARFDNHDEPIQFTTAFQPGVDRAASLYPGQQNAVFNRNGQGGAGMAVLRVTTRGGARITGWLPDGSTFTQATVVGEGGWMGDCIFLNRNRTMIPFQVDGLDRFGRLDPSGRLTGDAGWSGWIRQQPRREEAVRNFEITTARWIPTPTLDFIPRTVGLDNLELRLQGGNSPGNFVASSRLDVDRRYRVLRSDLKNFRFRYNSRAGIITGSFVNPIEGRNDTVKYRVIEPFGLGSATLPSPNLRSSAVSLSSPW
jgi:uncharacterized delta-60 repeat protein